MGLRVIIAGGGTGGHVIPAIAVANEIVRRAGEVRFIGSADRLEARLVPRAGFGIDFINVRPLVGTGVVGTAKGLLSVPPAMFNAGKLIRRIEPDVVLGVGGYVAGPVVMAAGLMRIPTAVLEQNAAVGLTNRILARFIDRAFVSYEHTKTEFRRGRVEFTGNPVDSKIIEASTKRSSSPDGRVRILIMGGSQGAAAIDERVPQAIDVAGLQKQVTVLHQSSPTNIDKVNAAYKRAGIRAEVVPFYEDMAKVYANADLVVARSGATTLAELTAVALPSVLLPYPHHSDNQQKRNAAELAKKGAAIVLDEKETGVDEMAEAIARFVRDPKLRKKGGEISRTMGRPGAGAAVVDGLEELAGHLA